MKEFIIWKRNTCRGVDNGTKIDLDKSNGDKLVFNTAFHHMDEHGYNGWTEHTIIVTPAFVGKMNLKVTGKNRNNVKVYLREMFYSVLSDTYHELSET